MNRIFRWGVIIALLVIVSSAVIAVRTIFFDSGSMEVPDLVGLSITEASEISQGAGLILRADRVESQQPRDTVISQSIDPGRKIARGKVIIVKVSKGGFLINVPDVRGLSFAEAVKRLNESDFTVGKVLRVTDSVKPAGSVIAQNPEAPAQVSVNRAVDLLISEGETGKSGFVVIPDLRGQTEELALKIIEQSELSVDKVLRLPSREAPAGMVLSTKPKFGARVPAGSSITIQIAEAVSGDSPEVTAPQSQAQPPENIPAAPEPKETQPKEPPAVNVKPPVNSPANNNQTVSEDIKPKAQQVSPNTVKKVARVRYPVPPLTKPMELRIEMKDNDGAHVLRNVQAKGGEFISIDQPYTGEALVTVFLGGDNVWQERFQ